jgi:hypothetical protein
MRDLSSSADIKLYQRDRTRKERDATFGEEPREVLAKESFDAAVELACELLGDVGLLFVSNHDVENN